MDRVKGELDMKYKLIAIDMDGTLLNSKNEISAMNRKAIKKANDMGIKIVLSTGRIFSSAIYYAKLLNINTPIISCNGAYVYEYYNSRLLYDNPIDPKNCIDVIRMAEENNMYYHFYNKDTFFANELNHTVLKYYRWNEDKRDRDRINIRIEENPIKIIEEENPNVYKFVFVDDNKDKITCFRKKLCTNKNIEVASSWWNNVEVMNREVSKGKALEEVCSLFGIKRDEVVAIGDNENDISMLKFAGLSIAMDNGEQIAKDVADFVTDSNDEDGVGKVIEKLILN
jgi:Cof subfamily protein (haloacid dehalogenase superfamily)